MTNGMVLSVAPRNGGGIAAAIETPTYVDFTPGAGVGNGGGIAAAIETPRMQEPISIRAQEMAEASRRRLKLSSGIQARSTFSIEMAEASRRRLKLSLTLSIVDTTGLGNGGGIAAAIETVGYPCGKVHRKVAEMAEASRRRLKQNFLASKELRNYVKWLRHRGGDGNQNARCQLCVGYGYCEMAEASRRRLKPTQTLETDKRHIGRNGGGIAAAIETCCSIFVGWSSSFKKWLRHRGGDGNQKEAIHGKIGDSKEMAEASRRRLKRIPSPSTKSTICSRNGGGIAAAIETEPRPFVNVRKSQEMAEASRRRLKLPSLPGGKPAAAAT